jgi:GNAT superfamily N-acetyltransferase
MEITTVVQGFNSINNKTTSEIHRIAEEEYGDYNWLYEPQESDKILRIEWDGHILAFCLYSLVDNSNIDRYGYTDHKEEMGKDLLIINHIIVRPQYQGMGFGREMIDYISNKYDRNMLCKAWVPDSENKNEFFEKIGFSHLEFCQEPWDHIDFRCLGCRSNNGCVCSGVVYAKK